MRKNKKYLMIRPYHNYLDGEIKRIKEKYPAVVGYNRKKEVKDAYEQFQQHLYQRSERCKKLKHYTQLPKSKGKEQLQEQYNNEQAYVDSLLEQSFLRYTEDELFAQFDMMTQELQPVEDESRCLTHILDYPNDPALVHHKTFYVLGKALQFLFNQYPLCDILDAVDARTGRLKPLASSLKEHCNELNEQHVFKFYELCAKRMSVCVKQAKNQLYLCHDFLLLNLFMNTVPVMDLSFESPSRCVQSQYGGEYLFYRDLLTSRVSFIEFYDEALTRQRSDTAINEVNTEYNYLYWFDAIVTVFFFNVYVSIIPLACVSSRLYPVNERFNDYFALGYCILRLVAYTNLMYRDHLSEHPRWMRQPTSVHLHACIRALEWGNLVSISCVLAVLSVAPEILDFLTFNPIVSYEQDNQIRALQPAVSAILLLFSQLICANIFITKYKSYMQTKGNNLLYKELETKLYIKAQERSVHLKRCFQRTANALCRYGLFEHKDLDFLVIQPSCEDSANVKCDTH